MFTEGFDPATALIHTTRIRSFDEAGGPYPQASSAGTIVSDTEQLKWHHGDARQSFVTIETDRSQAFIGFVKNARRPLRNLATTVESEFCSVVLTSLDDRPISRAERLLLVATARSAHTGMQWNDKRTSLTNWGEPPTVIEPVRGSITLRNLQPAERVEILALDGGAALLGSTMRAEKAADSYRLHLEGPATPWYLIRVLR